MADKYYLLKAEDRDNLFWKIYWDEKWYEEGIANHAPCVKRSHYDQLQHDYGILRCLGWWEDYQEYVRKQEQRKARKEFGFSFNYVYEG